MITIATVIVIVLVIVIAIVIVIVIVIRSALSFLLHCNTGVLQCTVSALLYAKCPSSAVPQIRKDHHNLLHCSPLLNKARVRRIMLDQWFPLIKPWKSPCAICSGPEMGKLKWVTKSVGFSCQLNSPKASAFRQLSVSFSARPFRGHWLCGFAGAPFFSAPAALRSRAPCSRVGPKGRPGVFRARRSAFFNRRPVATCHGISIVAERGQVRTSRMSRVKHPICGCSRVVPKGSAQDCSLCTLGQPKAT